MIITGFSSKPFQALYTYYVVQAKSWGVCRKKSLPPPFSRVNQRINCALPMGRRFCLLILGPHPQYEHSACHIKVCFMKQWLCNLPEGRWAEENKNARNGKLVIKKLCVITCALMQRGMPVAMTTRILIHYRYVPSALIPRWPAPRHRARKVPRQKAQGQSEQNQPWVERTIFTMENDEQYAFCTYAKIYLISLVAAWTVGLITLALTVSMSYGCYS